MGILLQQTKEHAVNEHGLGKGDIWTWVAIDADTKLVPSWLVGGRDADYAEAFIADLAADSRIACN